MDSKTIRILKLLRLYKHYNKLYRKHYEILSNMMRDGADYYNVEETVLTIALLETYEEKMHDIKHHVYRLLETH